MAQGEIKAFEVHDAVGRALWLCVGYPRGDSIHPAIWLRDAAGELHFIAALGNDQRGQILTRFLDLMTDEVNAAITHWETKPHDPAHQEPPRAPDGPGDEPRGG